MAVFPPYSKFLSRIWLSAIKFIEFKNRAVRTNEVGTKLALLHEKLNLTSTTCEILLSLNLSLHSPLWSFSSKILYAFLSPEVLLHPERTLSTDDIKMYDEGLCMMFVPRDILHSRLSSSERFRFLYPQGVAVCVRCVLHLFLRSLTQTLH